MKNYPLLFILFLLLINCKSETSKVSSPGDLVKTEIKKTSSKIEKFDCASFFKKGDYSKLCFTDLELPEHGGDGNCIFDFELKGNKQEQDLELQFVQKGSVSLAEMHFNLDKNNYKKGVISDVSNLGDAAFFDVHGTDLKSLSRSNKDLHVRYINVSFVILAEYKANTEEPCFYRDEEMITFAETILENLH